MANEELVQRSYLTSGTLKGDPFGSFECLNIGATSATELRRSGAAFTVPDSVDFPFTVYKPPKNPGNVKPDRAYLKREGGQLVPVATNEDKAPTKLSTDSAILKCAEQGLFAAAVLNAPIAILQNGEKYLYVNVRSSLAASKIIYFEESRDFSPAVLENLLQGDAHTAKDPGPLAESIWQMIWQATKEEPKGCLLTFVEIFVLKFLSDNLPKRHLPDAYSFYTLLIDKQVFQDTHGKTAIEYYVEKIRPFIKTLFPDNTVTHDPAIPKIFGLTTLVSKTSVINGFAFLKSSSESLSGFNRVFTDILQEFQKFGPLTNIDPEFKLRLYETFLKRSARQQKLGQFFTPRNVVRPMIKMAQLEKLASGSVVLDPAAGVGGFVLEPPLVVDQLQSNTSFVKGLPQRKIKLVGVDVDANTHILAKANTLIHHAESLRDPAVTLQGLNYLMADTFVLMNSNETLGSLENPPSGTVDIILTNPPYVTRGSAVYKDEVKEAGTSPNGTDLVKHYDRSGLGVESLFIRYITKALKPGGKALVIVPLGLLNRTEPEPKKRILSECNLLASIALPRNTFFNTAQLTNILVLEKRATPVDPRPDVFCGIARTIGESLNWERVPDPDSYDLDELANQFVKLSNDPTSHVGSEISKLVPASQFSMNDRWDVSRFWTDQELVDLGLEEGAIARSDFVDEVIDEIEEISQELKASKTELAQLTSGPMTTVSLGDVKHFEVRSGTRITGKQLRENPGKIPVFSCFKTDKETKGFVAETFWKSLGGAVENSPIVTVNANGASVGKVYARKEKCAITDDVIIVQSKNSHYDIDYLTVALTLAVDEGGFLYEAKLFAKRVKELSIQIPVTGAGNPDVPQQLLIASAVKRFNELRARLTALGKRSTSARVI